MAQPAGVHCGLPPPRLLERRILLAGCLQQPTPRRDVYRRPPPWPAGEWYMRNSHFPGWGRPFEFASQLMARVGRAEESRDVVSGGGPGAAWRGVAGVSGHGALEARAGALWRAHARCSCTPRLGCPALGCCVLRASCPGVGSRLRRRRHATRALMGAAPAPQARIALRMPWWSFADGFAAISDVAGIGGTTAEVRPGAASEAGASSWGGPGHGRPAQLRRTRPAWPQRGSGGLLGCGVGAAEPAGRSPTLAPATLAGCLRCLSRRCAAHWRSMTR